MLIYSCAQVELPPGGVKDVFPPKFLYASPPMLSTNVSTKIKEIKLLFDELIILDNQFNNITISPPIEGNFLILPNTFSSKEVLIRFYENLKKNTTYSINFGESLRDNNEGNILSNFNYVFSTGNIIDSLKITGKISNYFDNIINLNTIVALYEINSNSIDFKKKPSYFSKIDSTGRYKFQNLKSSKYQIIAFNDENFNHIFDEDKEQIGFLNEAFDLNQSKNIDLKLSKVQKSYKFKKIKQEGFGKILFEVIGNPNFLLVEPINPCIKEFKITHKKRSDSLYFWFNPLSVFNHKSKNLRIRFMLKNKNQNDTLSMFYSMNNKSSFKLEKISQELIPKKNFSVTFNHPIKKINPEKILIIKNNKQIIPCKIHLSNFDKKKFYLNFPIDLGSFYDFELKNEALYDMFNVPNNLIKFSLQTRKQSDFAKLRLNIINPPKKKFFLELVNTKGKVIERKNSNGCLEFFFEHLNPGEYSFRILVDENENGFYDLADFKNKIYAEKTYLYSKHIFVPAFWEMQETWKVVL